MTDPPTPLVASLVAVLSLAAVHLLGARLTLLERLPRSRWLSLAGGISVAYVFVHLLPELNAGQLVIERAGALGFLEHHVYLLALGGLLAFYGLERAARRSNAHARPEAASLFWLHVASFGIYNALVGYLLVHREDPGLRGLLFFALAMAFHFLVNDVALRHHFRDLYRRWGRWLLALAVLAGWGVGWVLELHEAALALLVAFLSGGVILNVLKEELPAERESRFWTFGLGAALYTALLLAL